MSYPGNPNLADDAQRRVLSTFESMLREVVQGNHEEALMGCGLIERLDPGFQPATELRARLESADGAVAVDDLAAALDIELPEVAPNAIAPSPVAESDPAPANETAAAPIEATPGEPAPGEDLDQIETVETERFEDPGDQIDVMSDDEMREAMKQAEAGKDDVDPVAAAGAKSEASTEDLIAAVVGAAPAEASPVAEVPSEESPAEEVDDAPPAVDETATAELPTEPEDGRISALMEEGQAAFDAGEYQTAIDAWSRVFLIDLDHTGASEKVEEARRLMAEREREAEELFHSALEKLEAGDTAGARESLEATLERQPGHIGAREHLDRLQAGVVEADDLSAEPTEAIPPPPPVPVEAAEGSGAASAAIDAELDHLISDDRSSSGKILGLSPRFLAIAAVGVVLVLAAAWYLYSRREAVFPNAAEAGQSSIHAIERAQRQYARGRLEAAIATLADVPATDERHSEALALLERWQQEAAGVVAEAQTETDLEAAELAADRAALIVQARDAIDNEAPHRALAPLVVAAQMAPLNADEQRLQELAEEQLQPYGEAWLAYKDGDYRAAVRPLWERVRDNPDDAVARDLLISTQFNLARSSLLGGNPSEAAAMLSEAAKLAPRDQQIQQTLRFAEHYVGQPTDLRYRIFIKHLPVR